MEKHGKSRTRCYRIWLGMKGRCLNPKHPKYQKYGGSGIRLQTDWAKSFSAFHADMGDPPEATSIDRKDNAKGYYKENCRWATRSQQQNNRPSTNHFLVVDGQRKTIAEWAAVTGLRFSTIWSRVVLLGMSPKDAVTLPKQTTKNELVTAFGQSKSLSDWAQSFGMSRNKLYKRLGRGWPLEKALLG